jgi:hypothetical protein
MADVELLVQLLIWVCIALIVIGAGMIMWPWLSQMLDFNLDVGVSLP